MFSIQYPEASVDDWSTNVSYNYLADLTQLTKFTKLKINFWDHFLKMFGTGNLSSNWCSSIKIYMLEMGQRGVR